MIMIEAYFYKYLMINPQVEPVQNVGTKIQFRKQGGRRGGV